jgi:hypothetical protein
LITTEILYSDGTVQKLPKKRIAAVWVHGDGEIPLRINRREHPPGDLYGVLLSERKSIASERGFDELMDKLEEATDDK